MKDTLPDQFWKDTSRSLGAAVTGGRAKPGMRSILAGVHPRPGWQTWTTKQGLLAALGLDAPDHGTKEWDMDLMHRIAGAPISWGVSEVPGWGRQLPADEVLAQMSELGLRATEFGPEGFLPGTPAEQAALLTRHGLQLAAAFVPLVLHGSDPPLTPDLKETMDDLAQAGAEVLVLAAGSGDLGYDRPAQLDDRQWDRLLTALDEVAAAAASRGLRATLHPHVGTMIESPDEVRRMIDGSGIPLCLDTGHILVGGGDPVALAREHTDRIGHVHLKDVRLDLATAVRAGAVTYTEAVSRGMYAPLGQGDIDLPAIIASLERAGYRGWYVLEQDTILSEGANPVEGVRRSIEFVHTVDAETSDL